MSNLFKTPKVEDIQSDPQEDASQIARRKRRAEEISRQSFLARQQLLGPIQLKAPGIRRK